MSVFQRLRRCGERKKKEETSVKYNGSLALAMLEQATIITVTLLLTASQKTDCDASADRHYMHLNRDYRPLERTQPTPAASHPQPPSAQQQKQHQHELCYM